MIGHCILSHGFESGPDATKVTALAEAAERLGCPPPEQRAVELTYFESLNRIARAMTARFTHGI